MLKTCKINLPIEWNISACINPANLFEKTISYYAAEDPGFAKGTMASERGFEGGAPSGVQGQSPWWGIGAKPPPPWN